MSGPSSAAPQSRPFSGAVLAGGAGRRLGDLDKARLPGPDGRPLLRSALDALRAAGASGLLVAAGADPERLADLDLGPGVTILRDDPPDQGPLGGLAAILHTAPHPWTLVVATDMPRLDPTVLAAIMADALAHDPPPPAAVPRVAGRLQPLHAAWHRDALPRVRSAILAADLALHRLAVSLDARTLEYPDGPSFRNVNTPDDVDW